MSALTRLWAIACLLLFCTCQKELNFDKVNQASPALFSFTNDCSSLKINGDYKVAKKLGIEHSVEIIVDVDSIGAYNIQTDTVSGISFSGTGTFSNKGTHRIQLTGHGIPLNAGQHSFHIQQGNCAFVINVKSKDAGTAVFTYNGAPGSCTNAIAFGVYRQGQALSDAAKIKIDVNVVVPGTYSVLLPTANGITFSGTGLLETAGYGVVTLSATGTPEKEGQYIFTPPGGCAFAIAVNP